MSEDTQLAPLELVVERTGSTSFARSTCGNCLGEAAFGNAALRKMKTTFLFRGDRRMRKSEFDLQ